MFLSAMRPGPTGYGLYRQVRTFGYDCCVVVPSLMPVRAGDRGKTDRLDATHLARLLRASELTPVWVPDETHEAMWTCTGFVPVF